MKYAIEPHPAWQYTSRTGLYGSYGHVDFYGPYVVGQWFCLDAATGAPLWAKTLGRPDTIEGIDAGVIVASEMVLGGLWTATKGCYGISLTTGELLWTSHGDGFWNRLWGALDRIPGCTNEFRDTAIAVQGGQVICESGRILDIHNGRRILFDRSRIDGARKEWEDTSDARRLYSGKSVLLNEAEGLRLSEGESEALEDAEQAQFQRRSPPSDLHLKVTAADGTILWLYRLSDSGLVTEGNYFAWRYHSPFVYIIAEDAPTYAPIDEKKPEYVRRNETRSRLLVLDVCEGQIVQEISLEDEATTTEHRIEAINDLGVLISGNQQLQLFRAYTTTTAAGSCPCPKEG